jgi:subtilisin family serine protease
VIPAWLAGYSGKGVTISIIDDGLDHKHPELIDRYVSRRILGFFFCSGGNKKFIF